MHPLWKTVWEFPKNNKYKITIRASNSVPGNRHKRNGYIDKMWYTYTMDYSAIKRNKVTDKDKSHVVSVMKWNLNKQNK